MPNDKAFSELGKAYAQGALEHLFKTMGGSEVSLSQLLAFQASAVSWLAASGFGLAIEKAGLDAAEHFLSIMMAGMSACIRLKGAPVLVSFQAKMEPVEEELPQPPAPAPVTAPPPAPAACSCQLVDGECESCRKALKSSYLDLTTYLIGYLKEMAIRGKVVEGFCKPCGAKYADQVLAELAKDGLLAKYADQALSELAKDGISSEALKQQAIAIALQTVQAFGITDAPLTVAALRERQGA